MKKILSILKKYILIIFLAIGLILLLVVSDSFAIFYSYMIVLSTPYDGLTPIKNEPIVRQFLVDMINSPQEYTTKAYERKAISPKVRKVPRTTHSFYVISNEDNLYTLSYSATGKFSTSQGAWTLNTDSDVSSYEDFITGNNIWQVSEIKTNGEIDTKETLINVINKIDKGITYYYKATVNNDDNYDTCNTALYETMVIK